MTLEVLSKIEIIVWTAVCILTIIFILLNLYIQNYFEKPIKKSNIDVEEFHKSIVIICNRSGSKDCNPDNCNIKPCIAKTWTNRG